MVLPLRCGLDSDRAPARWCPQERVRLEGYLPKSDFMAALKNSLGRIAFVQKKYADAERWYGEVVAQHGDSHFAPEAMYRRAVAQYSASTITRVPPKNCEANMGEQSNSVAELGLQTSVHGVPLLCRALLSDQM